MSDASDFFANLISALRKERKWSRQKVADRTQGKISPQYIHLLETGQSKNISIEKLQALAQGLDVPVRILQQALLEKQPLQLPMIGRVAGGREVAPIPEDYAQESLSYIQSYPDHFVVEVMGDSMAKKLEHGDLAITQVWRRTDRIHSGRIYVLESGKKLTCKYLVEKPEQPGQFWLMAEQEHLFKPTLLDSSYRILGQVVEVRKVHSLSFSNL